MFDKIDYIGKSLIQHGPNNDRVYLMKLHPEDMDKIVDELYRLAIVKRYSKIFVKVQEWALDTFLNNNYKIEARVPDLFNGTTNGYFLSVFFNAKRSYISKKDQREIREIIELASNYDDAKEITLPPCYHIQLIEEKHLRSLSGLYKSTFKVYPFPVFKERYLKETMDENVQYFGVFEGEKLVAAASAEINDESQHAELTDFASSPKHLGQNLAYFLLRNMESVMLKSGIKVVYTIARACSIGMNKTFGRAGYEFGGTLVNNTNIGESIESMNVWYKAL